MARASVRTAPCSPTRGRGRHRRPAAALHGPRCPRRRPGAAAWALRRQQARVGVLRPAVAVGLTVLLGVPAGRRVRGPRRRPRHRHRRHGRGPDRRLLRGRLRRGPAGRFDGARNGFLSWLVALLATIIPAAVAAALVAAHFDVLVRVSMPTRPTQSRGRGESPGCSSAAVAVLGTRWPRDWATRPASPSHRRVDRAQPTRSDRAPATPRPGPHGRPGTIERSAGPSSGAIPSCGRPRPSRPAPRRVLERHDGALRAGRRTQSVTSTSSWK